MIKVDKKVLTAGFAMFSMFFGSGNLVYPLFIGSQTVDKYPYAILGLIVTAIIVPFLGLLGIILYNGSRSCFFANLGRKPAFILTFAMLSLMGPFGVMPRCITVSYGGFQLLWPELSFWVFSILFCALTGALIWSHHGIVNLIGRVLTPFLIIGVATIIIAGLFFSHAPSSTTLSRSNALGIGLFEGYQMMDLLAAFFFASTTVQYLKKRLPANVSPKELARESLEACFIGAGLLALIYIGFVTLGACYSNELRAIPMHSMLVYVADQTLGHAAAKPIACLTIFLACLTTATILVTLFAEFLNQEISRGRLSWIQSVLVTLAICFFVSLFGFDLLRKWIGFALEIAYPALIALTVANIIHKLFGVDKGRLAFWVTLIISASFTILYT